MKKLKKVLRSSKLSFCKNSPWSLMNNGEREGRNRISSRFLSSLLSARLYLQRPSIPSCCPLPDGRGDPSFHCRAAQSPSHLLFSLNQGRHLVKYTLQFLSILPSRHKIKYDICSCYSRWTSKFRHTWYLRLIRCGPVARTTGFLIDSPCSSPSVWIMSNVSNNSLCFSFFLLFGCWVKLGNSGNDNLDLRFFLDCNFHSIKLSVLVNFMSNQNVNSFCFNFVWLIYQTRDSDNTVDLGDVIYNAQYPLAAPDIIFGPEDENFHPFQVTSVGEGDLNSPKNSLSNWNNRDPSRLLSLIHELRLLPFIIWYWSYNS